MTLLKQVCCTIHGTLDRLLVRLFSEGVVMTGIPEARTGQIGWTILNHVGIKGEVFDIKCHEGTAKEPILIVTTGYGLYQAIGYLEGGRQPSWIRLPDSVPHTATS